MFIIQNTIDQWKIFFIIGGAVYKLTAAVFMVFGSVKIQSWNERPEKLIKNSEETG